MNPESFIKTARELIPTGQGKPRGANLRRAVSTAYYAMFHCLAGSCADTLIGGLHAGRGTDAWILTYRALNHRSAKARCSDKENLKQFSAHIRVFAETFARMQEQRDLYTKVPEPGYNTNSLSVSIMFFISLSVISPFWFLEYNESAHKFLSSL